MSSTPTSGLIVAPASAIRSAADLNGKTIGTRDLSNVSYVGAKAWLDKNGGDSKTIKWIEVPDANAVAELQAGRIDAATVSEPALDDALHSGTARSLASVFDAVAKRFLISGYFTSSRFASAQPGLVRTFASVMSQTARWANANRPLTARILENYKMPVAPGSLRVTDADHLASADVQPVLDLMFNDGLLKSPMHATICFRPSFPRKTRSKDHRHGQTENQTSRALCR